MIQGPCKDTFGHCSNGNTWLFWPHSFFAILILWTKNCTNVKWPGLFWRVLPTAFIAVEQEQQAALQQGGGSEENITEEFRVQTHCRIYGYMLSPTKRTISFALVFYCQGFAEGKKSENQISDGLRGHVHLITPLSLEPPDRIRRFTINGPRVRAVNISSLGTATLMCNPEMEAYWAGCRTGGGVGWVLHFTLTWCDGVAKCKRWLLKVKRGFWVQSPMVKDVFLIHTSLVLLPLASLGRSWGEPGGVNFRVDCIDSSLRLSHAVVQVYHTL